jgi:hypothetical protein
MHVLFTIFVALQTGISKQDAAKQLGEEMLLKYRRGYDTEPLPMTSAHPCKKISSFHTSLSLNHYLGLLQAEPWLTAHQIVSFHLRLDR